MLRLLALHVWIPLLLLVLWAAPLAGAYGWPGPAEGVAPEDARRLAAAFGPPLAGLTGSTPWAGFDARNPFLQRHIACFNRPWSELRHAGEDWFGGAGTRVHAVADGRVVSARDANYPGAVVIVAHELAPAWRTPWGGTVVHSVYAHLDPASVLAPGTPVRRGDVVGRIGGQGGRPHLHFEMRRDADLTGLIVCPYGGLTDREGRGYTDVDVDPRSVGYLDPSEWIAAHRSYGLTSGERLREGERRAAPTPN
jgi:murein DD-endopeptidase MepM/ murein hydrolase activator NlpD